MGIIICVLLYCIVMIGLHVHYMIFPKYWTNKFEFEIRNQKMTVEDFDYWLTTKFFAWPFQIFELCG